MGKLFLLDLRGLGRRILVFCGLVLVCTAGAAAGWREGFLEQIAELRASLPLVRDLAGAGSSASPALHLASLAYGLALPLAAAWLIIPAGAGLVAGRVENGAMADLLCGPHGRSGLVLCGFGVLAAAGFFCAAAAFAGALAFFPLLAGQVPALSALARLNLMYFFHNLMTAGCTALASSLSRTRAGARRSGFALFAVCWAPTLAVRAWPRFGREAFKGLSLLYDPQAAVLGQTPTALGLAALGLLAALLGARLFSQRDIPLPG